MTLQTGSILRARYRILKLIEQGGFGAIYQAWDLSLSRACAVKENLDASAEARRQFEREAKILGSLSYPNLPRVTDHFFIPTQGQYLVMDLVEGQDLQATLEERGKPVDEAQALGWVMQVCDALTYLHTQKPPVIHRDIKPANIRITPGGQAMLVDFGIARIYDPHLKTTIGARAVTPGFSPYEQYGQSSTDARSDIYALGATLYTLLTYQEPPESIQRVVRDPLVSAEQLNPGISASTVEALHKAMQMDAEQRFQSAAEFKAALAVRMVQQSAGHDFEGNKGIRDKGNGRPLPSAGKASAQQPDITGWHMPAVLWLVPVFLGLVVVMLIAKSRLPVSATPTPLLSPSPTLPISSDPAPLASPDPTLSRSPTPALPASATPLPWIYTVQSGDTCSGIAARYAASTQHIAYLNNMSDGCERILVGQKLLIPWSDAPESPPVATTASPLLPGDVYVSPVDGMTMAYIPAGVFLRGSSSADSQAGIDEKPQQVVYLEAFWIDRTEVTNAMYAQCVQAEACRQPGQRGSSTRVSYYNDPSYANYPVLYVAWQDAQDYCRWAGRRLPGEAEWEKAARGADGRIYPWGNTAPDSSLANYDNQVGDTVPVGSYTAGASPYGLLGMAGNVAEWVADWYIEDYYATAPVVAPFGPQKGEYRGLRGGSWFSAAHRMRTAFRFWYTPDLGFDASGFRCAQ